MKKISTAIEIGGSKPDVTATKPSFFRKNTSSQDFKDILRRVNDGDVTTDNPDSSMKPSHSKLSNLSQNNENREQLSEDSEQNEDNSLAYSEYMIAMSISPKSMINLAVLGKQDLSKEGEELELIPGSTDVSNTGQQIFMSMVEESPDNKPVIVNAQDGSVIQKLPDLVAVAGRLDNDVNVSQEQVTTTGNRPAIVNAEYGSVTQKLPDLVAVAERWQNNVNVSQEQVTALDGKTVMSNAQLSDLVTAAGRLENNVNVSEEQVETLDSKPVMSNSQDRPVAQKPSDLVTVAGRLQNNVNVSEEQINTLARNQGSSEDGSDIAQEKIVIQKLPDSVMVETKNTNHSVLQSNNVSIGTNPAITNAAQTAANQTIDQANGNNAENTNAKKLSGQIELQLQINSGAAETENTARVVASTGNVVQNQAGPTNNNTNNTMTVLNNGVAGQGTQNENTGEQKDSEKGSESPHGKQGMTAAFKAQVTGETLSVNVAPQNVITSKEPVTIMELPQKVSRLLDQAKIKDQDKPIFLQLKLEPEQLGELVIKLSYKKGEISAQFITSSLQAKDALQNTMQQLKDALAQHQVVLHDPIVSVGSGGEQSMGHNRQNFSGKKFTQNSYGPSGAKDEVNGEFGEVLRQKDVLMSGNGVDYVI